MLESHLISMTRQYDLVRKFDEKEKSLSKLENSMFKINKIFWLK